jgi:hypothetical protein
MALRTFWYSKYQVVLNAIFYKIDISTPASLDAKIIGKYDE